MDGPPTLPLLKHGPQRAVTLFPQVTRVRLVKFVNREEDGVFMCLCTQTSSLTTRYLLYRREKKRASSCPHQLFKLELVGLTPELRLADRQRRLINFLGDELLQLGDARVFWTGGLACEKRPR